MKKKVDENFVATIIMHMFFLIVFLVVFVLTTLYTFKVASILTVGFSIIFGISFIYNVVTLIQVIRNHNKKYRDEKKRKKWIMSQKI